MIDVRTLEIDGVLEIITRKFADDRGFFSETYNWQEFSDAGIHHTFVQDNHSCSNFKGVLRGLHYQLPPFAQTKLVRVVKGAILDVAVDIRRSSPTFLKWVSLEISAEKWNQLLVPAGFAHGFVTLEDDTEVIYKVTELYSAAHDRSIRFDDPTIGIRWPSHLTDLHLSDKDRSAELVSNAEVFA